MKRKSTFLPLLLLLVLLLNACVASAPPAAEPAASVPAAEPPSEPQAGGTLNVWQPNGWPEQSWPHRSNWESAWAISPMAEWLFWPLADGTLEPMLGESVEISEDGLVYTVHLREGVTWHDGEPFTAEDVLYTYELRYNPNLRPLNEVRQGRTIQGLLAYNAGEAERITGITVIDELTLQITLDSPDAGLSRLFIADLTEIVPKHIIETLDPEQVFAGTADYWFTNPVGTGPYKFVTYETDQYIEFARNESYWGGAVGPERLFLKIATPEVAVVQLQRGELDLVNPLQLTEVSRLETEATVDLLVAENNAQWYGLEMNYYTDNGLWKNPKAKQAFLYSIDRQAYVDSILQGLGTVRHSFFDGTPYACPTMTRYDYDPEKAKELWAEIGVDPATITLDLMAWTGIKARLDYLPIAQEYLRAQGFTVNVDIIDPSLIPDYTQGRGERGRDWDFHVLLFGPGADPGGILPFMTEDSTSNWGYRSWPEAPDAGTGLKPTAEDYTNPALPALIEQAKIESDPQKRIEIYQQIDCIWNEDLPALMTASPSFVAAKSVRLQGVDWQTNAGLGIWTKMYKPGSWWIWEQ
ncbi:MAG: ABC transporter substrate-binding protein [Caldilineaceae bacterium]|nr:ABC transporter substrate-binding protein [Caldilineaceae bacterium]